MAAMPVKKQRGRPAESVRWTVWWVLAMLVAPFALARATTLVPAPGLNSALEAALAAQQSQVDGTPVDAETLRAFYGSRDNAPLWIGASGSTDPRIQSLTTALSDAATEGLDPRWYHAEGIQSRLASTDPQALLELEILLTDGALRYAVHQTHGVSPPPPGDPEMAFDQAPLDASAILNSIAAASDPGAYLRSLSPAHEEYRRLRTALARYRQVEKDGGWPMIPDGPTLKVGMSSPIVPAIRKRLAVTGELRAHDAKSQHYDGELAAAVKEFQRRNGLAADGHLGAGTRAALNVPVSQRVDQIVVNMERWRWIAAEGAPRHVTVNVPAFTLELVENKQTLISMPVVVGKTSDRTPVFSSEIRQLVFNPSWFVPPSIARKEIFPKAADDADYLSREGYVVRRVPVRAAAPADSNSAPQEVTRLRQPPGPKNPLGRVKFTMPNVFGVYLHDTPSRYTFARSNRALSHGCVRLGKALALADALMGDVGGWEEQRKQILSGWDTRTIRLRTPMPVYVLYETAWSDDDGVVHFRSDIYGRDDALKRQMANARGLRSNSVARRAADGERRVAGP